MGTAVHLGLFQNRQFSWIQYACRYAYHRCSRWNIGNDNSIGAHPRMVSDRDSAQHLGARRNVDVPSDHRRAGFTACP